MKRLMALLLAVCMLLTLGACKKEEPAPPVTTEAETTAEPTEAETEAPTTEQTEPETTEAATEPEVQFRDPLTGEPLDQLWTRRPFAVMCNNVQAAMPQHGVSQAGVLYEVLAEGGVTRCCAFFTDLRDVETVGSLRSARPYYAVLSQAYDAVYVHAGGTEAALGEIAGYGINDVDVLRGYAGSAVYRDKTRLNMGYSLEHTLFGTGEKLVSCAEDRGYQMERPEGIDFGFRFTEDATPSNGKDASRVTVHFRSGGKTTRFTYNPETKQYEGFQHGSDYIDGNTGDVLCVSNVMALYTKTATNPGGLTLNINTCGSGEGYFAHGGKIVPIQWSRRDLHEPFVYTMMDGTPLELGIGHTYIALLPTGSPVDYE